MLHALTLALATLPQDATGDPTTPSLLAAVSPDSVAVLVADDVPALWQRACASIWAEPMRSSELLALLQQEEVVAGELTLLELLDSIDSLVVSIESLGDGALPSMGLVVRLRPERQRCREVLQLDLETSGDPVEHHGRDAIVLQPDGAGELWVAVLDWRGGFALCASSDRESALDAVVTQTNRLEHGAPGGVLPERLAPLLADRTPALRAYVDLGSLARLMREGLEGDEAGLALWEALGLDDVGWAGLRAAVAPGVEWELEWAVELPRSGLISLLGGCTRTVPADLARLAPAEAIAVRLGGYDLEGAWKALREVLLSTSPEQAGELDVVLRAARDNHGLDLERDLIEQLSGSFGEFVLPVDPQREAPSEDLDAAFTEVALSLSGQPGVSPGSVVVVGLREPGPVENLLDTALALFAPEESVQDERVGERWLSSLATADPLLQPTWAFLDDALVFSLQAGPVRAVLAQAADDAPPPWLDVEGNREALAAYEDASAVSFVDIEPWLRARIVRPLQSLVSALTVATTPEGRALFEGAPFTADEIASAVDTVAPLVPALDAWLAENALGTARSTLTLQGRLMRYRLWAQ